MARPAAQDQGTRRPARRGFTLIELLIVVVVIAILMAILIPAINSAIKNVRAASVTSEINALATALTQFKSQFNDYPPSRIVLYEQGLYNPADPTTMASLYPGDVRTDTSLGQLNQRSIRFLKKFWPRAAIFNTTGIYPYDINRNNKTTDIFLLTGDECLVFFLGGMPIYSQDPNGQTTISMGGFDRNPANPLGTGSSRTSPLYEFKAGRLVDTDGDGFPSYIDALGTPTSGRTYAYFASYGGGNYDPNDCNTLAPSVSGTDSFFPNGPLGDANANLDPYARAFLVQFQVNNSGFNSCFTNPNAACVSMGPNPYTVSAPGAPGFTGPVTWQNPETFQIISAGSDQAFGVGGSFNSNSPSGALAYTDGGGMCAAGAAAPDRTIENDNLSNFTHSRLGY
jgi:general secretion pathway protein G